jgi:hypothetical protein
MIEFCPILTPIYGLISVLNIINIYIKKSQIPVFIIKTMSNISICLQLMKITHIIAQF